MFESAPAFNGISGAVDIFKPPTNSLNAHYKPPIFERTECEVVTTPVSEMRGVNARRKREGTSNTEIRQQMTATDLITLQQQVLLNQMTASSVQL